MPLTPARVRALAGTASLVALALAAVPAVAAPADKAAPVSTSTAVFAWGVNNESSNSAFAPGTANFFSAGKLKNTKGSRVITQNEWSATNGAVTIQKQTTSGAYGTATWAGLKTQPNGQPLGSPTSGTFSNHRVRITGGTGTFDAVKEKATLKWTGSFTVLYYSGQTHFYVTNPQLKVVNGTGTLTGTLGGYGTSMDDQTQWVKLPNRKVTLATFSGVDVTPTGITATPAYRQVTYTAPAGSPGTPQVRTGANWGAFPSDFVDYQQLTGQHSYWYSSGGSTDAFKVALPLTVGY